MTATTTDMRDFIIALERETPRGLHPYPTLCLGSISVSCVHV